MWENLRGIVGGASGAFLEQKSDVGEREKPRAYDFLISPCGVMLGGEGCAKFKAYHSVILAYIQLQLATWVQTLKLTQKNTLVVTQKYFWRICHHVFKRL